jgi:NADPH:quinone reductase-like Zn-dependent oxidoreductase
MKAIIHRRFGSPDVLELAEVAKPELTDDGVLVRVRAASVNRVDWYGVSGQPYVARPVFGLLKPRSHLVGVDFAGTVESVGKDVTELRPGDEVFGGTDGAFAEYVCVRDAIAAKPPSLTFEEAAAFPVAALTALQGLRDKGRVRPGQSVLVNGASGGVGTFAVQIAKALGADVTAVCSTRNVALTQSLGADHVVDYTRDDFTLSDERYDVVFDNAGSRSWRELRRVLRPQATVLLVGGPKRNRLLGPLGHFARVRLAALTSDRKAVFFVAKLNGPDLASLRELVEAGKVKPVIDRRYPLSETAEALAYIGEGHARGKVVIDVPG